MEPEDQAEDRLADAAPPPPQDHTSDIRLGNVSGSVHIRAWLANTSDRGVRLITDDHDAQDLPAGAPGPAYIDGDAQILVAGPLAIAIETIAGDLIVEHSAGELTVGKVKGDARLDSITQTVVIERVSGDVVARNLDGDLTIVTAKGDVSVDRVGGVVRLDTVGGDATIRAIGRVEIGTVGGDLRAQELTSLTVREMVGGDVVLANIATCDIQAVRGDATGLDIHETCEIQRIGGDVRLRNMQARMALGSVGGDLAAQDLTGGITAVVNGESYVETSLGVGMTYEVTAGEIILRARGPINAQFVAQSQRGEVRTHLPLTVERHRQHLVGIIGKGEATVTLKATGGILLDAAGPDEIEDDDPRAQTWEARTGKHGFRVHIGQGPLGHDIDFDGLFPGGMGPNNATFTWPFGGGFTMSNDSPDMQEIEERLRDFGDRAGRAARKAAEKMRDYSDRAATRARSTDWDAVSREVRGVIERTVSELETAFRDIASEFNAPGTGKSDADSVGGKTSTRAPGATAQRIPIDRDDEGDPTATLTRDAQRRAVLEQVRSGDLTLEEANEKLREL